jgi:hypothetical protein
LTWRAVPVPEGRLVHGQATMTVCRGEPGGRARRCDRRPCRAHG